MPKRKIKKSKKHIDTAKVLSIVAWILSFITVSLASLAFGYYLGYGDAKKEISENLKKRESQRLAVLKKLESVSSGDDTKSVTSRLKEVLKKQSKEVKKKTIDASHEYDPISLAKPPSRYKRIETQVGIKPKLAIILDDVSVRSQVEAIKGLNLPLTMSFLPPSKARPNSAKLAEKEPFYMVHLPMEAMSFTKEEPFTLRVNDSQNEIDDRVNMLKKLFPRVKYINNHTGSKFTSNERAVNRLIYSLSKQNINFIDSRTIAETKVPKVMKNFGLKYVSRDVFLDHHSDKKYVKKQIISAIKLAEKYGSAIAIGHPHANTIMAIHESKALFKDIELVLVDRL